MSTPLDFSAALPARSGWSDAWRGWLPRLRTQSPNTELQILLGGPLALQHPQRLRALGADLVAVDARETVNWISQRLLQTCS